jgi:hypothetical protein
MQFFHVVKTISPSLIELRDADRPRKSIRYTFMAKTDLVRRKYEHMFVSLPNLG